MFSLLLLVMAIVGLLTGEMPIVYVTTFLAVVDLIVIWFSTPTKKNDKDKE